MARKSVMRSGTSYVNLVHFGGHEFTHHEGPIWKFKLDRTIFPSSVLAGDILVKKHELENKYCIFVVKGHTTREGSYSYGTARDALYNAEQLTMHEKKALRLLFEPFFKE